MNKKSNFYFGDKVKFSYNGRTIYGTVLKVNKKTLTINTAVGRFRATSNRLIQVKQDEWDLNFRNKWSLSDDMTITDPKNKLFKIGDSVNFNYKKEYILGVVEKINRKTIRVNSEHGRFRVSPSLLEKSPFQNKIKQKPIKTRNWSNTTELDYKISNTTRITNLSENILSQVQSITKELAKALNERKDREISIFSNKLISTLCLFYDIPLIKIHTGGKRILRRRNQMLGVHRTRDLGENTQRSSISVFSKTAKKQQYVKPKTFLKTLTHEFIHHYDRYNLKLIHLYHTKGFDKRVATVYNQLKIAVTY